MEDQKRSSKIPVGVASIVAIVGFLIAAIPTPTWAVWVTAVIAVAIIASDVIRYRQGDRALWQARR